MSLERLSLRVVSPMNGVEESFPPELRSPVIEIIRRYNANLEGLLRDLRAQVVVDTSLLPSVVSGEESASSISQSLATTIFTQTSSVTVANTTTESTLVGSGVGRVTIPSDFLLEGKTLRLAMMGYLSDTATPTLNMKVKLGSTTLVSTGAVALSGTISNNHWQLEALITCRGVNTLFAQGQFNYDNSNQTGKMEGMVATSASTVSTGIDNLLDITATWGAADAANTITCTHFIVEALG